MRRVLIVTGGLSPAVVTETVWALARQRKPAFWPERVIVVVTSRVKQHYQAILGGPGGKIAELATCLGRATVPMVEIAHTDCDDIRSDDDAIAFGDKVCEVVRRETAIASSVVHLSLAGGRKTMSFHGGGAMTLFGRPQDELSHVLVTPQGLEGCPDFWWPTREERRVAHRDQKGKDGAPRLYNTQLGEGDDRARVDLALIPFVRVRRQLPAVMLEEPMNYAGYVVQVNATIEGRAGVVLELRAQGCEVKVAGVEHPIKLEPKEFAVYRLLAEWARDARPGCGPEGIGGNHSGWLSTAMIKSPQSYSPNPIARLIALGGGDYRADTGRDFKLANSAFGEHISRIKRKIESAVANHELRDRLLSSTRGRCGIALLPHEIMIKLPGQE